VKVEFEERLSDIDVYVLSETEKPLLEVLRFLENACRNLIQNSESLTITSWNDSFIVYYGGKSDILSFIVLVNQIRIFVDRKHEIAEYLARMIFKEAGVEWPSISERDKVAITLERQRQERLKKLKESLSEFDYEVLELRSQGVSLWGIASKLGCSVSKVRWSVQKLALLPETSEKLGAYKPLSWGERFGKNKRLPSSN
jgi:ATP/maltotriose-dependent transcriptional regulator MalT